MTPTSLKQSSHSSILTVLLGRGCLRFRHMHGFPKRTYGWTVYTHTLCCQWPTVTYPTSHEDNKLESLQRISSRYGGGSANRRHRCRPPSTITFVTGTAQKGLPKFCKPLDCRMNCVKPHSRPSASAILTIRNV